MPKMVCSLTIVRDIDHTWETARSGSPFLSLLTGPLAAFPIQIELTAVKDLEPLTPETTLAHPKGGGMRTVTVRMHTADLSRQMAAMREWLDRHRYEPAGFAFYQRGDAVIVCVEFRNEREGEAFASHFDNQEPQRPPPFGS
jgi:hypothetical protein